jgi:hypothetical protein
MVFRLVFHKERWYAKYPWRGLSSPGDDYSRK